MFKIDEPKINNIVDIKYSDTNNIHLEEYYIKDDTIDLLNNTEINCCKFERIIFKETSLLKINIDDVIFINCDLSNIKFIELRAYRIKFVNCKLVGTNFINSTINNISIIDSKCDYINISGSNIKNIEVINSNFIEASLIDTKLKNTDFKEVNFKNIEVINTPLKDIDLSNSIIEGIRIDLKSLKGSIINIYQSMDLINLLGVKVK